jgi:hypothetical protein
MAHPEMVLLFTNEAIQSQRWMSTNANQTAKK